MLQESIKQVEDIVKFLKQVEPYFIVLISSFSKTSIPRLFLFSFELRQNNVFHKLEKK